MITHDTNCIQKLQINHIQLLEKIQSLKQILEKTNLKDLI